MTRHPLPLLAQGIAAIVEDEGDGPETIETIERVLTSVYERGLLDGADIATVLSGKPVHVPRRLPGHHDPISAYDD